ncbi:cell division ATP-binding protein FtsE [Clavibacter michiganensis]|uniref:Cell division ATP-binding protein FtsE n=3 Tax=Clavibacter michiganensis TaxID=28447 RepID=A0A0D5CHA6_9MICO|nr:cell division ATP-binding protein FtsE [Clavibacter michiganensis]AJW78655.1 ABC transporter ATP-binding protein [Clavibacter michiganensis subsp. insidiosus]AWG01094.1 cell division ATP-binding protein FtsE [Clavibacter michiganensis subsp. insidiosus]OQJ60340.1 cell division ATP-binding protein FtsE [Clavibacter michiganensis subsp. insidiosus]RMC84695.1 cell division ATP-binding protein FtsE [Clavibacter michiganensis subsp. insidiosus]
MIRFDHVSKVYPGNPRPALSSVDLEILRGEFVFLVGASGSGKSSFLRLVLKEDRPTQGTIHVLGQQLNQLSSRKVPYYRRSLGVVFQDFRLLPNKSVFDNVAFTLQVIGKSRGFIQEAVPDVLAMVGLQGKEQRLPHELSGGEQQRVAIARAVVNKPAVLLADEPTGNLDPLTSAGIMQVLERINANGTTVIMATHDSGIVDQMQKRVIELIGGEVVRDEVGGQYQTSAIDLPRTAENPVGVNPEHPPVAAPTPVFVPAAPLPAPTRPTAPAEPATGAERREQAKRDKQRRADEKARAKEEATREAAAAKAAKKAPRKPATDATAPAAPATSAAPSAPAAIVPATSPAPDSEPDREAEPARATPPDRGAGSDRGSRTDAPAYAPSAFAEAARVDPVPEREVERERPAPAAEERRESASARPGRTSPEPVRPERPVEPTPSRAVPVVRDEAPPVDDAPPAPRPPSRRNGGGAAPAAPSTGSIRRLPEGTGVIRLPDLSDGEGGSAPADGRDDAELAELGLAEKLGLRARGESPDDTGAQDVGPTR